MKKPIITLELRRGGDGIDPHSHSWSFQPNLNGTISSPLPTGLSVPLTKRSRQHPSRRRTPGRGSGAAAAACPRRFLGPSRRAEAAMTD